jgi:predicted transcriptional regulator
MTYQLPPDIDQRVLSKISLGIYKTPAQVLNEALDALDMRDEDLAAILRGIEDEKAGRMTSLADFDSEMRQRYGFPTKQ